MTHRLSSYFYWGLFIFKCFQNNLHNKQKIYSFCHLASVSSVQSLSRVQLFVTPWTAARQASLSITNSQLDLVIYQYVYINFFRLFSIIDYYWVQFPVPYSRSLLFTYFIYSSVYILIPNSLFISPISYLSNHKISISFKVVIALLKTLF